MQFPLFAPADAGHLEPAPEPSRHPWAWLLRRVFAVEVSACPRCPGRMRIVQIATEPESAARLLADLGLGARAPPWCRSAERESVILEFTEPVAPEAAPSVEGCAAIARADRSAEASDMSIAFDCNGPSDARRVALNESRAVSGHPVRIAPVGLTVDATLAAEAGAALTARWDAMEDYGSNCRMVRPW